MAYSRIVKIGDGSTTIFTVNFPLGYFSEDDITARVGTEVDGLGDPVYRPITFLGSNLLQIGGTAPGADVPVVFERTTDKDTMVVNFQDGDVMDEENLDKGLKQAVLLVHEVLDGRFDAFSKDVSMGGFRLTNVGTPTEATDTANKAYVDARIATGSASAQAAALSASAAYASEVAAFGHRNAAAAHENASWTHRVASEGAATAAAAQAASLATFVVHSRESAASLNLSGYSVVQVNRWSNSSVFAPANYEKVAQPANIEPAVTAKFQDSTGLWFILAEREITPIMFGAKMDGSDDYEATQRAIDFLPDELSGMLLTIPSGTLLTSQTLVWSKLRSTLDCVGKISPYGTFDGYLLEMNHDGLGYPHLINVALRPSIRRLEMDGLWQSRGLYIEGVYLSCFSDIFISRTHGTAIEVDGGFETTWLGVNITLGKNRPAPWFGLQGSWSDAVSYVPGDIVQMTPPVYDAGITYGVNDYVSYGAKAYRSNKGGNLNHDPTHGPYAEWWSEAPIEYYECMLPNTNKSPHGGTDSYGYTMNAVSVENRYWKRVPPHEPLLKLDSSKDWMVLDNMMFYGLMIRDSDNKILVWIDNNGNERHALNFNFTNCQIHAVTLGLDADTAPHVMDDSGDRIMVQLGRVQRTNFIGSYIRPAHYENGMALVLGGKDPSKVVSRIGVQLLELSGEGDRQQGIHVGSATFSDAPNFIGELSDFMAGTNATLISDPNYVLSNRQYVRQLFSSGDGTRPGIASMNNPDMGFVMEGDSIHLTNNGTIIATFGLNTGVARAMLPKKIVTSSILDGYADDAAAAAGGVEIGGLYRNGTQIHQRCV